MNKVLNDIVNKGFFGFLYLLFVGIVGSIALMVTGVGLAGNLADLGTGISQGNVLQVILWAVSVLVLAGVAILLTKHSQTFKIIGRKEEDKVDLPTHYSLFGLIAIGVLISTSLFVLAWFVSSMGGTTSITEIGQAWASGDVLGIIGSILVMTAVGYVVFFITSNGAKIQKKVKTDDYTKKLP